MKNRILFLIKLPPPVNGATTINQYIYSFNELRKQFSCVFINHGLANTNKDIGLIDFKKFIKYLTIIFFLFVKLIKNRYDLCYITVAPVGQAFFKDSIPLLLLKLFRINIVIHLHGKGINLKVSKNKLWLKYYKFCFNNTKIICLSTGLSKDIEKVYFNTPIILPNAKPIEVSPQKIISKKPSTVFTILFLSNLIPSKGIYDYIDALKIVKKSGIDFNGIIVGNSTSELTVESLRNYVKNIGLADEIIVAGPKYGNQKTDILLNSDILVFPTYYKNETWGMVILEAMEAGIPVITTPEGAIPDIIEDGKSGFIVSYHNPEIIAKKLVYLAQNSDILTKMGVYARKVFLSKYDIRDFEKKYISILKDLIN